VEWVASLPAVGEAKNLNNEKQTIEEDLSIIMTKDNSLDR